MVAANKDPSCNSNNNWRLNKIEKIDQKKIDNTTITTSYNNNTSLGKVILEGCMSWVTVTSQGLAHATFQNDFIFGGTNVYRNLKSGKKIQGLSIQCECYLRHGQADN